MKPLIGVITAHWGAHVVRCLESIYEHTPDFDMVWIANGSSVVRATPDRFIQAIGNNCMIVCLEDNVGVPRAYNLILGMAQYGQPVVICDDDIEVSSGWWEGLAYVLDTHGIATPMEDRPASAVYGTRPGEGISTRDIIPFFCTAINYCVFSRIGLFDPRFGSGFGVDNDYCIRAQKLGISIGVDHGTVIHHPGRTTTNAILGDQVTRHQQESEKLLREKWGV